MHLKVSIIILALILPAPLAADEFVVTSRVTAVELNPDGRSISRSAEIEVPAGRHQIIIVDMPSYLDMPGLVSFTGGAASVVAIGSRAPGLYPLPMRETDAERESLAALRKAEGDLRDLTYRKRMLEAEAEAARARVAYLKSLNGPKSRDGDTAALTGADVTGATLAIGAEYLAALNLALAAERGIAEIAPDFAGLERAVRDATERYEALKSPAQDRTVIAVTADFRAAMTGTITFTQPDLDSFGWVADYDLRLAQDGDHGLVSLVRKAALFLGTDNERWENVRVTLSSAPISRGSSVRDPDPRTGHLEDRPDPKMLSRSVAGALVEPMVEPIMIEESAPGMPVPMIAGQVLRFELPGLFGAAAGGGRELVTLDTLEFGADLTAKIVPAFEEKAYLVARVTNTSGGPLLPGTVTIYRDGVMVGADSLPAIGIGAEIELPFGEYDGIEVKRNMVEKIDGDVGIITSSNRRVIRHRTTITSHLAFSMPVRVLDNLPVSEDEDLVIAMQARPQPGENNVDGARGVVAWNFGLEPGKSHAIEFGYEAQWPPDKDFRIGY